MKFTDLLGLVLCILTFNTLLYGLGLLRDFSFVGVSIFFSILLIILTIYVFREFRKGLILTITSITMLYIYSYSMSGVLVKQYLGPYTLLLISLISSLALVLVVLRSDNDVAFTQSFIIFSLPLGFIDLTGVISMSVIISQVVFLKSLVSVSLCSLTILFSYLPYALLPLIADVRYVNHLNIFNIIYWEEGTELNLLKLVVVVTVMFSLFGVIYVRVIKNYIPKVRDLKYLLISTATYYSLLIILITTSSVITTYMFSNKLVSVGPQHLIYITIPALTIPLIKSFNDLFSELSSLKVKATELFKEVNKDFTEVYSVASTLVVNAVLGLSVSRYYKELDGVRSNLRSVEDLLKKHTYSIDYMNTIINELVRIKDILRSVRDGITNDYLNLVNDVKNTYTELVLINGLRDYEVESVINVLLNVKRFEDIPAVGEGLSKLLVNLCGKYISTLGNISRNVDEVLGIRVSVDTSLPCKDVTSLTSLRTYREVLNEVSNELTVNITNILNNLLVIRERIDEFYREYEGVLSYELRTSFKELLSLLRTITISERSIYRLLGSIKSVCTNLRRGLTEVTDLLRNEVGVKEGLIVNVASSLGIPTSKLLPVTKEFITKTLSELTSYNDVRVCSDFISRLASKGLNTLHDLLLIITLLEDTLRKVKYLPLIFTYLDDRLVRGDVPLNDIPLNEKVLKWFVDLYLASRSDVVIHEGVIRRVSR